MHADRFGWPEDVVSGHPRLSATRCGDTLFLRGELDLAAATSASAALAHPAIRTVDVSAVTFIDAAGLRVLLDAHRCWSRPRGLRLRLPSRAVLRLLDITGERRTFSISY